MGDSRFILGNFNECNDETIISGGSVTFKETNSKESLMQSPNLKLEPITKSLTSFHEILSEPYSTIIRDASLLRFQRSVEIFWKLMDKVFRHVVERVELDFPGSSAEK